jgi:amidase
MLSARERRSALTTMQREATELATLDGLAQAELVRRREITALEAVEAAIARAETLNPTLNALVTPTFELAREAARRPLPTGPLAGAPMLLKDLGTALAGVRHTEGSVYLRDHVDDHDSELVGRFKRAGLLIVGKANTAEFGNSSSTEPELFGACRNPWDPQRIAGGSSGGSAAAVAAGIVPLAHGGDSGGSIRIPASCCGVFGLKPTRGRNPLGPGYGDFLAGLETEHVLTRSVRDSAAALDATSGPYAEDPYPSPPAAGSFLAALGAPPPRLRVAVSAHPYLRARTGTACAAALRRTAALCAELGHDVLEADPALDLEALLAAYFELWADGNAQAIAYWTQRTGRAPQAGELGRLTLALADYGRRRTAEDRRDTLHRLERLTADLAGFFSHHDVWLAPTLAEPALALGALTPTAQEPLLAAARDMDFTLCLPLANLTGQPAMSVPLCSSGEGLPIGMHFMGRFGDEATLLRLAAQLEEAQPWAYPVLAPRP